VIFIHSLNSQISVGNIINFKANMSYT